MRVSDTSGEMIDDHDREAERYQMCATLTQTCDSVDLSI